MYIYDRKGNRERESVFFPWVCKKFNAYYMFFVLLLCNNSGNSAIMNFFLKKTTGRQPGQIDQEGSLEVFNNIIPA